MLGTKIPELMSFPAKVSFKVVGANEEAIDKGIRNIMEESKIADFQIETRESKTGKYISFSVTLEVADAKHMEDLYVKFSQVESVLMVI
ncbi:HP0495 family protein [Psittacicella gerlachiana]|uniref:Uncharacterized protein n=1 Tax=Psittacicella gerlachiana TaxID=2028574 RepID=A0A3A1YCN0_9GAMM|nr:DUF493 domain-containing protein [Psittacicella gerlachiana]RIY33974.1 hypothetical protein CKF59_05985 [Psittacicella gerlachiana]